MENGLLDPNGNYPRRDFLREMESKAQKKWETEKAFQVNSDDNIKGDDTFFVTFPYPYQNGRLHLGHVFTLSKIEFAAGYERMKGKHVLFPFGFHCTGMPIKAAADKIKNEIAQYGNPPVFEVEDTNEKSTTVDAKVEVKSKIAAKSGNYKFQWSIMKSLGLKDEEISAFADPNYWLEYFPPHCEADLKSIGMKIDWRRSFITTPVNPYYDSFVRWQMNTLKAKGYVAFGKRNTIYSPTDGQPCMDHDRSSGEGVGITEYTLVKMEVLEVPSVIYKKTSAYKKVYIVAATLRPETMHGQTNCFVHPELEYGAYEISNDEVFLCTPFCARNLKYQLETPQGFGKIKELGLFIGKDLLGVPLKAPECTYDRIYTYPMTTIIATMGTGIVTSVPSDSPDDYMNFTSLKNKPEWRARFGITDEMIMPYEPVAIIKIPELETNLSAKEACESVFKIKNVGEKDKLAAAKKLCYDKGFHSGVMIIDEYKDMLVSEAKEKCKQKLLDSGEGVKYGEPASAVISRSGDECVVALVDQWYIDYGLKDWKERVVSLLESNTDCFDDDVHASFLRQIDNLHEWACSRSFGLGSRIPWDEQFLVESLSDSTVYMAYYTVAHFLQSKAVDGSKGGLFDIKPEQMTDDVWNYVFLGKQDVTTTDIPRQQLDMMRQEFEYWYPLNIRVSGKDLINNHLSFFLFTHEAIWGDKYFPKGVRCNGHLKLNNKKMSKSEGNFITLEQSVQCFGADATRLALADAGDSVEDGNLDYSVMSRYILRLYNLEGVFTDIMTNANTYRTGELEYFDTIILNQLKHLMQLSDKHYSRMLYGEAVKQGFFNLNSTWNLYLELVADEGMGIHKDVAMTYMRWQILALTPVVPHVMEHCWSEVLQESTSLMKARWPVEQDEAIDGNLLEVLEHVTGVARDCRLAKQQMMEKKKRGNKKGKKGSAATTAPQPEGPPNKCTLYIAKEYREDTKMVMDQLKKLYHEDKEAYGNKKNIAKFIASNPLLKPETKRLMQFAAALQALVEKEGPHVLDTHVKFDELSTIAKFTNWLKRSIPVENLSLELKDNSTTYEEYNISKCEPMQPVPSWAWVQ